MKLKVVFRQRNLFLLKYLKALFYSHFYIHCILLTLLANGNDVAFYADDSAFLSYRKVSNPIVKRMQKCISSANKYYSKWNIKVNEDKTQTVLFPFSNSPKRKTSTSLNSLGNSIPFSYNVEYLGVNSDVLPKIYKCGRRIFPLLIASSKLSIRNKILLYTMCIRPIVTYACQV